MNNKICKLLFKISFLPYLVLILISTYYAIFGYDVYTWILPSYVETIYGVEAFIETLIMNSIGLCLIPVLPIILVYQIVYMIVLSINKQNIKE